MFRASRGEVAKSRAFCDVGFEILGVSLSQNSLGVHYRDGTGVDVDHERAFRWFLKSANNGCVFGMNNIAHAYRFGQGTIVNFDYARGWYEEAVKLDYGIAMINLGDMYSLGLGVKKDINTAKRYYIQAQEKGVPGMSEKLSLLEMEELSVFSSREKSIEILRTSAEKGELESMLQLGILILDGEDVFRKYSRYCWNKRSTSWWLLVNQIVLYYK